MAEVATEYEVAATFRMTNSRDRDWQNVFAAVMFGFWFRSQVKPCEKVFVKKEEEKKKSEERE